MFSTFFYTIILFIQSFYAESNYRYNQQIELVNKLVSEKKFKVAYKQIKSIESRSIFTNNDLNRMKRNLALKVGVKNEELASRSKVLNEHVINMLSYFKKKEFKRSLSFCMDIIVHDPILSDTMIKMYEIVTVHIPVDKKESSIINQARASSNLRLNEAINLLDLMKRKEKTLF